MIIEEASYAYERVCGRVPIKELRPSQLIYSGELGPRRQTMAMQTLSNLVVAGIGVMLASPRHAAHRPGRTALVAGPGPVPSDARRVGWHPIYHL